MERSLFGFILRHSKREQAMILPLVLASMLIYFSMLDLPKAIINEAIQMHGAIGFTEDCDVGLYVKRAMTLAAWLGNGHAHKRRYARTEILEGAQ